MGIRLSRLKELIVMCTLNGKWYRWNDGVAIGLSLGPSISDIFLAKLERSLLRNDHDQELEDVHEIHGDTFIICDSASDIYKLLDTVNIAHSMINFTVKWRRIISLLLSTLDCVE